MAAANEQPGQNAANDQTKAAARRRSARQSQRQREPRIEHGYGKKQLVIHSAVEPVKTLHGVWHALYKRKQKQQGQWQRQHRHTGGEPAQYQPGGKIQAEKQRNHNAEKCQPVPGVAE